MNGESRSVEELQARGEEVTSPLTLHDDAGLERYKAKRYLVPGTLHGFQTSIVATSRPASSLNPRAFLDQHRPSTLECFQPRIVARLRNAIAG